jgi:glycosyltransferase involved in cell wall biosynthesis
LNLVLVNKMKRGLIILLCRNALHLSRRCLETLLAQTADVDILVIDNASSDGTAKYMAAQQARHTNIYRLSFPMVTSVARCWNEALTWAWGRGFTEALVVNSDTELLSGTYDQLLAYMRANKVGMVTAVGVAEKPGWPDVVTPRPHPDYSCFMIAAWAHRMIPFDQHYEGAYFEDADHHVRMFRAGIWAGSINIGFLHHSSGTLKCADPAEDARIRTNYAHNKQRFLKQYGCVPGSKAYERLFLPAKTTTAQSQAS